MTSPTIVIKAGREKPIIQQHPWIFSGAIDEVKGDPTPGEIVTVTDKKGRFLARGYWNPKSQIQVRILTWHDEAIDEAWWRKMLKRAIDSRGIDHIAYERGDNDGGAYRMVNAESDYIPGLVVDRYEEWVVLQALTLGIDQRKQMIAEMIPEITKTSGVFERSDVDVRGKEGLKDSVGVLWGNSPPKPLEIQEYGKQMLVDVYHGHKTGFYLDQRENRQLLGDVLSQDFSGHCDLLNLFSYTGGFSIHALAEGGVKATNVDSSYEALELAEQSIQLNGFDEGAHGEAYEVIQADVFEYLHDQVNEKKQFDIVVLDPPKFAHNAGQVDNAARGYKDINLNAFKVVKSGGYLMTFSCSGAISADLFQKIVFGALADSGRQAQILKHLGPASDHPVALTFPEGAYLKGLLLKVY
ncbi:MAG: class I SAM-dependent rRNA methyltransferase [Chloroflexi bacterium]|nr:class I SAM-dependent rRNA methyltransferase [Chloroflexota bacterium]MCC6895571.1 class I SAM-dependent rRNA methyltransferase [Anaerolineae bacterium]